MSFCPKCGNRTAPKMIGGIQREACSSPGCPYVFWDNPVPVVAAIVEHEGKVVLVRNAGWPEKMFGLVSGFLEKGETADAGVIREVREELGVEANIEEFIGYYSFVEMNQLLLVFHVTAHGDIAMGEELQEYRAVLPEKVRPWPYGTGPAVRDWMLRKGYLSE